MGCDEAFGAPPLKRAIQRYVLDAISMEILEGRIRDGQKVKAHLNDAGDGLTFESVEG